MTTVTTEDTRATINRAKEIWVEHGVRFRRAVRLAAEEIGKARGLSPAELARMTMDRIGGEKAEARDD